MAEYIQVAGKSNILIGFPSDYTEMMSVGEQMDDTKISIEQVLHDIPGDSQGGPQGDPIEQQILALRVRGQLNLSKWDPAVRRLLIQHGVMATEGSFKQSEIGALLLRDRSLRIVISPSRDTPIPAGDPDGGKDYFYYNFPCCTVTSPIETGQGTKFSALSFQFRAWRVPEGHDLAPGTSGANWRDGLIWNRDATDVDDVYLPPGMKVNP
jgi:hypothetical protein